MNLFGSSPLSASKGSSSKKSSQSDLSPLFLKKPFIETFVVSGNLKKIVKLPRYVDSNEWLASHAFDFFSLIYGFYGVIQELGTSMRSQDFDYTWFDPVTLKKDPNIQSTSQYFEMAFSWMESQIENDLVFPTKAGESFAKDFDLIIKAIFRLLARTLAFIYGSYYEQFLHLQQEGHLNTLFAHFITFSKEFQLLGDQELLVSPLKELISAMESSGVIPN